jgi:hypothetical protein
MSATPRLASIAQRIDDNRLNIVNPYGVPVTLFANRDVPIEIEAIDQALALVSVQQTIEDLRAAVAGSRPGARPLPGRRARRAGLRVRRLHPELG